MSLDLNREKILALIEGITELPDKEGGTEQITLQSKSVTPTKQAQTVTPDSGYDGLQEVGVGAIPDEYIIPSGTISITENGTHDVSAAAAVEVMVQGEGGGGESSGARITYGILIPSEDRVSVTVEHGLGVVPDKLVWHTFSRGVAYNAMSLYMKKDADGFSIGTSSGASSIYTYSATGLVGNSNHGILNVNENTFDSPKYVRSGAEYIWIAIAET